MLRMTKGLFISIVVLLLSLPAVAQDRAIWKEWGIKLEPFVPENPWAGVIVCPGGSYHWLDYETEGVKVAQWLASEGIAAFVLKYRVAGKFEFAAKYRTFVRGHRHPDMISDLQRAIQWFRCNYDLPLGVMGFSAGGHLVMSAGEFYDTDFNGDEGCVHISLRPDFVVPVYPVVTLSDKRYVHKRSRLGLLGEWTVLKQEMRDSLSLEKHVRADGPPVFLINCVDDPIVDYHNSVLLDSALTAAGVPHRYVQMQTGGHGFGADPAKQNQETSAWQGLFLQWLRETILTEE